MQIVVHNLGRPGGISSRSNSNTLIKFNADHITGYTPLPKMYEVIRRIPIFQGIFYESTPFYHSLRDAFDFHEADKVYRFRKMMRGYSSNNPMLGIQILMMSVFGLTEQIELAIDEINPRQPRSGIITNNIDVFSLALIKTNKIGNIEPANSGRSAVFDPRDLLILISKNKLKSPVYMKNRYNATARKYLWEEYRYFMERFNIETQIVDDDEIARYYHNPYSLKTSSITEMMQIDQKVKEDVFSNAKALLTI